MNPKNKEKRNFYLLTIDIFQLCDSKEFAVLCLEKSNNPKITYKSFANLKALIENKAMTTTEIIISIFGWAATLILVCSTIPQAVRTLKTKDTESLSIWMLILALTSGTLFTIYGVLTWIYVSAVAGAPIAVGNFLYLIFQGMTFSVKLRNTIAWKNKKKSSHEESN